jgi:uncharacterized protein YndB with AHSA1/START domain
MNADSSPRTLVIERELSHPPQKVWRALTQGPLLEEWLMRNDFEPQVGRRFTLRAEPMPQWNGVIDCQVLELEPCTRLSYSWNALGVATVVTFTLTPTPGGVLLRMEQSGHFPAEANYQGAQYGWRRFLANLEGVVAALA